MKIHQLNKGDKIISANNRIWEVVGHDYPATRLRSGGASANIYIMSEIKKIKGGYIILKSVD